jgi:hypothetical protein
VHPLFLSEAVEFAGSHNALSKSKAPKHGHCRGKTSSIGAVCGDDGIWIYGLAGSFVTFNNVQIPSCEIEQPSSETDRIWLIVFDDAFNSSSNFHVPTDRFVRLADGSREIRFLRSAFFVGSI